LTENILIHCTAGAGRTGHLILTFELLKYYHEIFSSQDPVIISNKILEIVERIRQNRPALIATTEQFNEAIKNADILYRYALEKKYIQAGMPVHESVLSRLSGQKEQGSRDNILRVTNSFS